ncbi:MAG: hypothetical protein HOV81_28385 [Kofleriaceae bacterium]|nr:hypothetical protein [Kofleriaceae bacterium]
MGQALLDRLASAPTQTPDETGRLHPATRTLRLRLALGAPGPGLLLPFAIGCAVWSVFPLTRLAKEIRTDGTGMRGMMIALGVCSVLFAVAFLAYAWRRHRAMAARRAARLAVAQTWPAAQPFEVTGLESWLVADRPLFDLHATGAMDQAKLAAALRHIAPAATVEPAGVHVFRIELPPVEVRTNRGMLRYADFPLLERVFAGLIVPLHGEGCVARVTMGGLVPSSGM